MRRKIACVLSVSMHGCNGGRAKNLLFVGEDFEMVRFGASTHVLSLDGVYSPWFVVPGSDRILRSRNKNTQYFPPERIVESDTTQEGSELKRCADS